MSPRKCSRERAWHVNRMSLPSPLDRTPPKVLVEGEAEGSSPMSLGAPPPPPASPQGAQFTLESRGSHLLDGLFQALGTTLELARAWITCASLTNPMSNRPA